MCVTGVRHCRIRSVKQQRNGFEEERRVRDSEGYVCSGSQVCLTFVMCVWICRRIKYSVKTFLVSVLVCNLFVKQEMVF